MLTSFILSSHLSRDFYLSSYYFLTALLRLGWQWILPLSALVCIPCGTYCMKARLCPRSTVPTLTTCATSHRWHVLLPPITYLVPVTANQCRLRLPYPHHRLSHRRLLPRARAIILLVLESLMAWEKRSVFALQYFCDAFIDPNRDMLSSENETVKRLCYAMTSANTQTSLSWCCWNLETIRSLYHFEKPLTILCMTLLFHSIGLFFCYYIFPVFLQGETTDREQQTRQSFKIVNL